jgi:allantoinase
MIAEARAVRVDVTAETCSHYLLLNDKDVGKLGASAKCAPPIRDEKNRQAMWRELRTGNIQTIGSDHSPSPPDMKTSKNFFEIWGGIAGVQHGFQLLMSEATEEGGPSGPALPLLAAVLARNVARRFRLDHRKGLLAVGRDADFTLVEYGPARRISADELWTRHRISPYIGRKNRTRVTHTYVRGCPVWADGGVASASHRGQFLRPTHT